MSGDRVLRRLLFGLLLMLPVVVVCGGFGGYTELNQDEAGCGDSDASDFFLVLDAGSTNVTLDPDSTDDMQAVASDGAASVQAAVAAAGSGASLAIQMTSPDSVTPVSADGSFRVQMLCADSTKENRQTVLNLGGPSRGFSGGTPANATASITATCGTTPPVTYNPAFGGIHIERPMGETSFICDFEVVFTTELTNGNAFLYLNLQQLLIDLDGDGIGGPFDQEPTDPSISVPPDVAEVDHQTLGLHPLELALWSGSPPDLSGAQVELRDADPLDVINAAQAERVHDEAPILILITEEGGCLVVGDGVARSAHEATRCPVDAHTDLSGVLNRPSHGGDFALIDDPDGPVDIIAPTFVRKHSRREVDEVRTEMLDPSIETFGSFELKGSRLNGFFTKEAVALLAGDLSAASGNATTREDLLRKGIALISFETREGQSNTETLTLFDASPGFDYYHFALDGSVTQISAGDTAPSAGGLIGIVNQDDDTDGSGVVEPDESETRIASYEIAADSDVWRGSMIVVAGHISVGTEKAGLDCENSLDTGQRPYDACIETSRTFSPAFAQEFELHELLDVGCNGPLGSDEDCADVDSFALGRFETTVQLTPAEEAVGCQQVDTLGFGGRLCADTNYAGAPGTCAVDGGEGCPDLCAVVGGICVGGGGNQYCSTQGFRGCTDQSVVSRCGSGQLCRPYLQPGGVETLPKYACIDTSDCPPDAVCESDGFCGRGLFCKPSDPSSCAAGQTCIAIEDGIDGSDGDDNGRCFDVATAPCFEKEGCPDGFSCQRINEVPAATPRSGVCELDLIGRCHTFNECNSLVCMVTDDPPPSEMRGTCLDELTEYCDPLGDSSDCSGGLTCQALKIESFRKTACVRPAE